MEITVAVDVPILCNTYSKIYVVKYCLILCIRQKPNPKKDVDMSSLYLHGWCQDL